MVLFLDLEAYGLNNGPSIIYSSELYSSDAYFGIHDLEGRP